MGLPRTTRTLGAATIAFGLMATPALAEEKTIIVILNIIIIIVSSMSCT